MEYCPITKERILENSSAHIISYSVKLNDIIIDFTFCRKCFNKINFNKYRGAILGLILNNKFYPEGVKIHWDTNNESEFDLKKFLEESYYPKTPKEKYDNLISELYKNINSMNNRINFTELENSYFSAKCYFNSYEECKDYLKSMNKKDFIDCENFNELAGPINFSLTFEGLNYLVELENNGSESKNCFIAMAFKKETDSIRKAIKNAIINTGFKPIIIDEQNIDSDQTINDAIIVGIKKSKFCISDFSYHRNGVYFESGFALGLGKPVIYCCSKEEFSKAHFDIKPLQHIIYESEEELEKRLMDKIEAWIK